MKLFGKEYDKLIFCWNIWYFWSTCHGLEYFFPIFRFSIKTFTFPVFFVPKKWIFLCDDSFSFRCFRQIHKSCRYVDFSWQQANNLSEQAALIMQKHAVLPEVISTVGGTWKRSLNLSKVRFSISLRSVQEQVACNALENIVHLSHIKFLTVLESGNHCSFLRRW